MAKDQASEQMDATAMMAEIGAKAKAAAKELAYATAERKHAALIAAADAIWDRRDDIAAGNALDMDYGREKGLSPCFQHHATAPHSGNA